MLTPTILLLHEEGPGVGLGHKYRMVALGEALRDEGAKALAAPLLSFKFIVQRLSGEVHATVIDARVPQAWPHQGQRVMVELDGTVRWDDGWAVSGPGYAMIRKGFREHRRLSPPPSPHKVLVWVGGPNQKLPYPPTPEVRPWGDHTEEPWLRLAEEEVVYCPASMRALEAACMGLRVDCWGYDDATRTIKGWLDNGATIDGYGAERVAKLILKRLTTPELPSPG